jgi:hypothetical protein
LRHAVKSVDRRLNAHWGPYPIFILTSNDSELDNQHLDAQYSQSDSALMQSWLKYSNVTFIGVEMYSKGALERGFTSDQFKRWNTNLDGGIGGRPIGYRSMCRLWSERLQNLEFLNSFQYYMRLDDDSFFTGDFRTDPFQDMKRQGLQYAYRQRMTDTWGIKKMWQLALPYMNTTSLMNMRAMGFLDRPGYTGSQPYNNFHVASVKMFRHPLWRKYMGDVEREHGFFKYRFGDANVHAIAMGMLLQPKEVAVWGNIRYVHNFNNMPGYPPQNWKSECLVMQSNTSFQQTV